MLELLEDDPAELLGYLAAAERPPTLLTRENEPLVACRAEIEVPSASAAALVLDERYELDEDVGGDTWLDRHELGEWETVVRAWIRFADRTITVETMSEGRLDAVLDTVLGAIPGARVVEDERTPVRAEELATRAGSGGPAGSTDLFVPRNEEERAALRGHRRSVRAALVR